ncbi:MAG: HesB/IscA family protein [Candidatus Binatia bacterium]
MAQELFSADVNHADAPALVFTGKAVEMIKQAVARTRGRAAGIRVKVTGSGCKGFEYGLTLAAASTAEDTVIYQDGITAYLDPASARHLQGTRLDYVSNRHGTGFHFFGMDVARTIGCGSPALLRRCIEGNFRTVGCIKSAQRPLMDLGDEIDPVPVSVQASVAHSGMRPRTICPHCHYVACRCDQPS